MRSIGLFAALLLASAASAQQAVQLPHPPATPSQPEDTFRFVSDGPAGPGWGHHDEIARKYFHEDLPALFERTIMLDAGVPDRATLRWIFTGPRAGLTVELTSSKVRISERYYDSTALYEGQGNYPEKTVFSLERQFTGDARTLTVIADAHLAARVLVNGLEILEAPMLFDVTRHQLMLAASRTAHDVVSGSLRKPELSDATITLKPSDVHQTMLGFGGSPSIPAYSELSDAGKREYWQILKRYNLLLFREYPMGTELKPDMSNLDNLADSTPHYYGDNFPNSELSSFDYSRHILALGGSVIYELWALPSWADVPGKKVADPDQYARILVTYCQKAQAATGAAPAIVGLENEVDQPPEVFAAMAIAVRRALDNAGFTQTKIHMADASYMFLGIDRANALRQNPDAWRAVDFSATHEYDFQEFISNPDLYDARMKAITMPPPASPSSPPKSASTIPTTRSRPSASLSPSPSSTTRTSPSSMPWPSCIAGPCSAWSSPRSPARARCLRPTAPAAGFPCPPVSSFASSALSVATSSKACSASASQPAIPTFSPPLSPARTTKHSSSSIAPLRRANSPSMAPRIPGPKSNAPASKKKTPSPRSRLRSPSNPAKSLCSPPSRPNNLSS
jgi:hypothetical protein